MTADLLEHLGYFAIGITWFSVLVLIPGHLLSPAYAERPRARAFGIALLLNLSVIQGLHYLALAGELQVWSSPPYLACMFCTGAFFLFFCRAVLRQDQAESPWAWLAIGPPLLGALAPGQGMFFVSLLIGTGYFVVITLQLLALRSQRRRFAAELVALVALFVIAGMTLLLGLLLPRLDQRAFVASFAILNGMSFLPALLLLVRYPDLLNRAEEALALARANSTLASIDVQAKRRELQRLMEEEHLYRDDTLNLASLAEQLRLSPHQTSELLNQHLGLGFPRFLRRYRVEEACELLRAHPRESVLSIGLRVGFSSQSTFYTAFKEEIGLSPGQYRKRPASEVPA